MRCSKIIRGVHAFLNFFLLLIGVFLCVIAILVLYSPGTVTSSELFQENKSDSDSPSSDFRAIFNSTYLAVFAWACVVIGVIIIVLSLCGCLGSCFQSVPLLSIYIFALILVTLIQVGCGVIVVLSPEWFKRSLNDSFEKNANGEEASRNAWAALQLTFQCCGVNGADDYGLNETSNNIQLDAALPCCAVNGSSARFLALDEYINRNEDESLGIDDSLYINRGQCEDQLKGKVTQTEDDVLNDIGCVEKIYGNLTLYGIISITVVAIEIVIIVFSCIVCCHATDSDKPV